MSTCCRTCDHRNDAVHSSTAYNQLNVCLITLTFKTSPHPSSKSYLALNTVLNNITDNAESTPHPSTFTSWSPCLSNPSIIVIITTASETCSDSDSPVFHPMAPYLSTPPTIRHIYLPYSVLSLSTSSPDSRIACDIITLQAPTPGIAVAIGKHFGWDPQRSSLSSQLQICAPAAFSTPGDLTRDFWAWAELSPDSNNNKPVSPSSSTGHYSIASRSAESLTQYQLTSTNSDEKNMALWFPDDDEEPLTNDRAGREDETLIMLFQWNSHADGDRFKHPLQKSLGPNSAHVSPDLWDRCVAHPVRQLQGLGTRTESYRLELRGVGQRIEDRGSGARGMSAAAAAGRERSGSRRLSVMASGLGKRVSGLW